MSEATIGYTEDKEVANRWSQLFTTPYFLVSVVSFLFSFAIKKRKKKNDLQKKIKEKDIK